MLHYNIFRIGDQVVMCREFKDMQPDIAHGYKVGIVESTKGILLRVRMPSGILVASAAKYWLPSNMEQRFHGSL